MGLYYERAYVAPNEEHSQAYDQYGRTLHQYGDSEDAILTTVDATLQGKVVSGRVGRPPRSELSGSTLNRYLVFF